MFTPKCTSAAIVIAALLAGYPQTSFAEGFSGSDVLKWNEKSQNSYFRTSVSMAGVIASQNRREAAQCIDDWYFKDEQTEKIRADYIRSIMKQYPDYVPQAVIFAAIRKACGKLF